MIAVSHLEDFELAGFFEDPTDEALRDRVLTEIAVCEACRRLVAALAEGDEVESPSDPLGRYAMRDRIGTGAWGSVYRAHDEVLGREVAIKLVHLPEDGEAASETRVKLTREGRLLARCEHPNVVRIFDAISVGSDVALVMELIPGGTLEAWVQSGPGQAAILRRFCEAGRGLAAAHEAGVVHGDFKPRNVLLDGDRVVVADFGLGHVVGADTQTEQLGSLVEPTWGGTPGYLAPERALGGPATEGSDQYAFAMSVVRASKPATSVEDLPRHLRRPLARMLDPDPARRFPSMAVAVAGLESARPRSVMPLLVGTTLGVVAMAVAVVAWPAAAPEAAAPRPSRRVFDSDNPQRRALEDATALLKEERYTDTLATIASAFDLQHPNRTREWVRATNIASKAHGMLGAGEQQERLAAAGAGVAVEVGAHGLAAELMLTQLAARMQRTYSPDVEVLLGRAEAYSARALEEPGEDLPDQRTALDVELARAAVQTGKGDFDAALETVGQGIARAHKFLGPQPHVAGRMYSFRAKVRRHVGKVEGARADAHAAVEILVAVAGADTVELLDPLAVLMHDASASGDYEAALGHSERAVAVLERAGRTSDVQFARALSNRGGMLSILDRLDEAAADLVRAEAILEEAEGADVYLSSVTMNLARVRSGQGRHEEGLTLLERARVVGEGIGRPDIVARTHLERCRIYAATAQPSLATLACDRADREFTETFGAEHPARGELEALRAELEEEL